MTNYITKAQYTRQKAALTRAINLAKAAKDKGETWQQSSAIVEAAVRKTVHEWIEKRQAWPDDWTRWQRALEDARPWNAPYIDLWDL